VAVVEAVVAASVMMMAEGGGDGKVEQRWMWHWTVALKADVAIDSNSIVGCCRCE
jgi:hypothetical protein